MARKYGFEIVEVEEVRIDPDRINESNVDGVPADLVVKLRKPEGRVESSTSVSASNSLNMLPKKLNWSKATQRNPRNSFFLRIPDQVKRELYKAALDCYDRGISVDELDSAGDFASGSFSSLKSFAVSVRNALLHETGLALLKGLDLDVFSSTDHDKVVACSKLAYYLLCNHIGAVDGSARGRLFDVKDNNIDAKSESNVLFSNVICQ